MKNFYNGDVVKILDNKLRESSIPEHMAGQVGIVCDAIDGSGLCTVEVPGESDWCYNSTQLKLVDEQG